MVQAQKVEMSTAKGFLDRLYLALCQYSREITANCYHLDKKSGTVPGETCYGFHLLNTDQVTTCPFFCTIQKNRPNRVVVSIEIC